jgi:transcription antitermination factor NusB
MRRRTLARRLAVEVLYQADLRGPEVVADALASPTVKHGSETQRFAEELVRGVLEHLTEIDELIRSVAQNWDLARMATVDRNILRLGTYELVFRKDIPGKVTINEAVDLAKRYGTAESGTFVNGILDRIMAQTGAAPESAEPQAKDPSSEDA